MKGLLSLGQSLVIGSQGLPPISTVTEAANCYLVNPTSGALSELKTSAGNQRPDLTMGYRIGQHRPAEKFGASTHGQSGQPIANLLKGGSSGQYEKSMVAASASRTVETSAGGTYAVDPLHLIQGEADQTFGTLFDTYVARALQLYTDYNTDIPALTGQSGPVPLIMSQTATWAYYGNAARIGLAQLALARTRPNMYVVGGQYQLPYAEGLHMTAVGYYRLGELHARAHNAVVDGAGWAPFAPTNVALSDTQIVLTFHVPTGALEFDTSTVPAQPNKGFSLGGTTRTVTSATISGPNTVTLGLSGKITEPGATIGYGIAYGTGPGLGNLCDGETANSGYDGTRLANWALHFSDPLPVVSVPPFYSRVDQVLEYRNGSFYEVKL